MDLSPYTYGLKSSHLLPGQDMVWIDFNSRKLVTSEKNFKKTVEVIANEVLTMFAGVTAVLQMRDNAVPGLPVFSFSVHRLDVSLMHSSSHCSTQPKLHRYT